MDGEISADQVELGRTARVSGDVVHEVLAIEAGAFIDGYCRHKPEAKPADAGAEGGSVEAVPPQPVAAAE